MSRGRHAISGIIAVALLLATLAPPATAADRARPPNVVLILMDDMGWRDCGFMGNTFIETPHIDRLAKSGLVFAQAYASAPNCAPTRACLMSGQYTPRHGIYTVVDPRQPAGSPWHKLLAAAQFAADYGRFLDAYAKSYPRDDTKAPPRFVLVSPIAVEATGDPLMPDADAQNRTLAVYRDAIKSVAE